MSGADTRSCVEMSSQDDIAHVDTRSDTIASTTMMAYEDADRFCEESEPTGLVANEDGGIKVGYDDL